MLIEVCLRHKQTSDVKVIIVKNIEYVFVNTFEQWQFTPKQKLTQWEKSYCFATC